MENAHRKVHKFISGAPYMTVLQQQAQQLFYDIEIKDQAHAHASVYQRNYLHVKTLNNSASFCIEFGQYNKAISFLAEALPEAMHLLNQSHGQYQENNSNSDISTVAKVCRCQCCSLDGCIAYSEEVSRVQAEQKVAQSIKEGNISHNNQMKQSSKDITTTIAAATNNSFESNNENRSEEGEEGEEGEEEGKYIHRKPIHVTPKSLSGGHNMGSTLSLIVVFNLALALQLKAADTRSIPNTDSNTIEALRTSMNFYEVAYKWQAELVQPSLRFNLILCNNISQIHRMEENHLKHEECLQHLLSLLMHVIDCERRNNDQDGNHCDQQDMLSSLNLDGIIQNLFP